MARVFITGSSTGLGLMAGQLLAEQGHAVVLHGRNPARGEEIRRQVPQVEGVVTGDLSTLRGAREVADQAGALGRFDAVIHNAGMGHTESGRGDTEDGLPPLFATNVLAPYVLTALMPRPDRLVYLSSGLHNRAQAHLEDLDWRKRRWDGLAAYSETKLYDTMLAFAAARRWPDVLSNSVEPGWVATRMGGPSATDDLDQGHRTQAWLAVSDDAAAKVSGQHFRHMARRATNPQATDIGLQDALLAACERLSGVNWQALAAGGAQG